MEADLVRDCIDSWRDSNLLPAVCMALLRLPPTQCHLHRRLAPPAPVALPLPAGAHHLDLMFSHPLDPPSVKEARRVEEHFITTWAAEARARSRPAIALRQAQHAAAYQ